MWVWKSHQTASIVHLRPCPDFGAFNVDGATKAVFAASSVPVQSELREHSWDVLAAARWCLKSIINNNYAILNWLAAACSHMPINYSPPHPTIVLSFLSIYSVMTDATVNCVLCATAAELQHFVAGVRFHLWSDKRKESWLLRRWPRIWSQRETQMLLV